jgi:7-cyano-7-deazaguanine synthase
MEYTELRSAWQMPINRPHDFPEKNGLGRRAFAFGGFSLILDGPDSRRGEKHLVVKLNLRDIGGSALTDDIDVPKDAAPGKIGGQIPITYVPARNTIFLSVALAWAEKLGANRIFIGANAVDYSGYPDCRPVFIEAFEKMANLATKAGVEGQGIRIEAPLINLSKAQIITRGLKLGLDYSLSLSCYDPDDDSRACGQCESCVLRHKGFVEAKADDPTIYRHPPRE